MKQIVWAVMLMFTVMSCERRLKVYADPWLSGYAKKVIAAYESENPGVKVELKVISSEVIAWHVKYGQPVDVFLCFGPDIVDLVGIRNQVRSSIVLAGERMVLVEGKDSGKYAQFKTEGCTVVEATHRPGRRMADDFVKKSYPTDPFSCKLIADFQRQMEDYLLLGWIPHGIVPESFQERHSNELQKVAQGEWIQDAYVAFQMENGMNAELAADFLAFLATKKSSQILAQEMLFP